MAGLIMLKMTGSLAMVGFTTGILGMTRLFISYPAGKIADSWGRIPALLLGLALLSVGAVIIFYSVGAASLWLFLLGLVIHGLGQGAVHQMRIAVADMFPIARKAEGVSYVMTGSMVGALGGPALIAYASSYAQTSGLDPYATPWLFTPAMATVSALLVLMARPDPRSIAQHLEKYYPDDPWNNLGAPQENEYRILGFFRYYPIIVALLVTALTWGNMSMMMSMVSIVLQHHGFDLAPISVSVMIHVLGMYAFSIPFGRMADRWGRRRMLVSGAVTSGVGALVTTLFEDYWVITVGIFLVGLGWSAAIVTSTAVVADVSPALSRGRILGIIELSAGALSLAFPVTGGLITSEMGFTALGIIGLTASIPTAVAAALLKERSPGKYDYSLPQKKTHVSSA